MVIYNADVINIGNFGNTQLDTVDGITNGPYGQTRYTEGANLLEGHTFGSTGNPLYMNITKMYYHDADTTASGPDGRIPIINDTAIPSDGGAQNWLTEGASTGTKRYVDSAAIMSTTVTYSDGTTKSGVVVRIMQLHARPPSGARDIYILPPFQPGDGGTVYAGEPGDLTDKPVVSIRFDSVISNAANAILVDRFNFARPTFTPCLVRGTMIATATGTTAVEDLRVGDLVATADNGLQSIRWIGSRKLYAQELDHMEKLRPIRIKAGALGAGLPLQDLLVSPQHRMLVRSKIVRKMCGSDEALIAAKHLCALDGISIAADMREVTYFHILFDSHQIILANGAETESLYLGTQSLIAFGKGARDEILALFPDLAVSAAQPTASRHLVNGRRGRQLAERHMKNGVPLIAQADSLHCEMH